ncbi:hypothetical protein [Streptomyces sp. NPDC050392]|uniref:hypothetical protein n=1 Tax=Streptomyces sp. NPDC050392 TaxID=3155782 RepID=UPI003444F23A
MHELHLRAGRPTLSDLARALAGGVSRSRLHDAFTSGRLPRWEVVDALVETLGSRARGTTPEQEIDRFHALWQNAVPEGRHQEPMASALEAKPRPLPPRHHPRRPPDVEAADGNEALDAGISLYMSHALLDRIQGSPWQARIEDGFLYFLTGDFRPVKPDYLFPREDMTIVSARVDSELLSSVVGYAREHAGGLGWAPSPKQVAVAWLLHTFPPAAGQPAMVS